MPDRGLALSSAGNVPAGRPPGFRTARRGEPCLHGENVEGGFRREAPKTPHYDVVILGSGAGGGTLARHLAPSGKRILLLERGDWLRREIGNWDVEDVFLKNRYISPDTWYDAGGKPFQPQVHYNVGGATKLYGAALYRLRPQDFGELHHVDGVSPAWSLTYDDLCSAGYHPLDTPAGSCSTRLRGREHVDPRAEVLPAKNEESGDLSP